MLTDRQIKQTHRQIDRQIERDGQTGRQIYILSDRHTDRQADRKTGKQT